MDNLHRQGSWSGSSLSIPPIRGAQSFGLPFAAHFATSSLTTSSSLPTTSSSTSCSLSEYPPLSPELEEVLGRMKQHLENGKWEPEDSQALLSLLDEGWYSKSNKSKKQSHLKSSISTNNTPRGTPRPTTTALALAPTATQGTGQIPAIRPLDLSSLREHTTASAPTAPALESGVMFSARSTATTTARWTALHYNAAGGDAADTPRSWITAASMAASLPQSKDEMDAMDIEEVRQLVEDADVLQQRATVALKLAQARLRRQQQWRHLRNISAVFFVLLNLALMMIAAVVDLALIFMDVCVRLVCGQNSSISNSNSTALSLSSTRAEMVYAFLGGVAGAAQGIVMSLFGSSNTRVD